MNENDLAQVVVDVTYPFGVGDCLSIIYCRDTSAITGGGGSRPGTTPTSAPSPTRPSSRTTMIPLI